MMNLEPLRFAAASWRFQHIAYSTYTRRVFAAKKETEAVECGTEQNSQKFNL